MKHLFLFLLSFIPSSLIAQTAPEFLPVPERSCIDLAAKARVKTMQIVKVGGSGKTNEKFSEIYRFNRAGKVIEHQLENWAGENPSWKKTNSSYDDQGRLNEQISTLRNYNGDYSQELTRFEDRQDATKYEENKITHKYRYQGKTNLVDSLYEYSELVMKGQIPEYQVTTFEYRKGKVEKEVVYKVNPPGMYNHEPKFNPSNETTYTYKKDLLVSKITESALFTKPQMVAYTYNEKGQCTGRRETFMNEKSFSYVYNEAGQVISEEYGKSGRITRFTYDEGGRLILKKDIDKNQQRELSATAYQWNKEGLLESATLSYGGRVRTSYRYQYQMFD